MEYDFTKPPTNWTVAKWGKNKKPHLFIGQPGTQIAVALFQSELMAEYFEKFMGITTTLKN